MLFFIIFGWRGCTFTKERGDFHCPQCGAGSAYVHKTVRNFFTLYFIPLIPLNKLGEYVECGGCQGTYDVSILTYDPSEQENKQQALFMVAMKQVMIGMLLADGVIDDDEVIEVQNIFEDLTGVEVTEKDLREEIEVIQQRGTDTLEMIGAMAEMLNDPGKEKVVKAAYRIAGADGEIDPSETAFLDQLAHALKLSRAHFRGILAEGLEQNA